MFTIGDFAAIGQVSVRMLRHYDQIGLLRPARVDPVTGYRSYDADQLPRLNRILALKDLGFSLQQVRALLDDKVSVEQMEGMLLLRRNQLEADLAESQARLRRVEARLRAIEGEGQLVEADVVVKAVPATRVAELTAGAASYCPDDIGPIIEPLYAELTRRLTRKGIKETGPCISYFEDVDDETDAIVVHATVPVADDVGASPDLAVVQLPAIEKAATIVHRGPMEGVGPTFEALLRWVEDNGYRSLGYSRELSWECPPGDHEHWVTELQCPIAPT